MDLRPYVPRLVLEWAASEPERRHRTIQGTGVFADLSGFTALSERLARIGREGAEELTDVIDATFTALLEPAYEAGGSLLKFGGDALFLFFEGEEHELRGCWTAHAMRRVLRDVGKIQTPSGARSTLRMTTGVHTGPFDFFLVGSDPRQLLVVGAETTRLLKMEGSASTGRIVISPKLASRLPRRMVGPSHGAGRLLQRAPSAPRSHLDQLIADQPSAVDASMFISGALRSHLTSRVTEPEHRNAAVAFVRIAGIDGDLSRCGPDAVGDTLDRFMRTIGAICDRHRVTLIESDVYPDGVKVLVTAGVPTASELNEEHLLRAVTDDALEPLSPRLQIGVHQGHLFAGAIGPSYRRTYTVMGDSVNTAARIMQQAAAGEVLSTQDSLRRSRVIFEVFDTRVFRAKGKKQELEAVAVGKPTVDRRDVVAAELPLVGRNNELRQLREAIETVQHGGTGSVLEVVGPAGVGKSRLISELVRESADARILQIASDEIAATSPYFAAAQLLRQAVGCSGEESASQVLEALRAVTDRRSVPTSRWVHLLGVVLGSDADPVDEHPVDEETRRARLTPTFVESLTAALDAPTLIVIEDAHWLDAASVDALKALLSHTKRNPWVVVLTRRSDHPPVAKANTTIELLPLSEDDAIALALQAVGRPLLRSQAAELIASAEGNPLFLREILVRGPGEEIPGSIETLIAARIDALPPEERSVLRYLSVLGSRAPGPLVHGLIQRLGGDGSSAIWNVLGDYVFWVEDRELRFRHALLRAAAYTGLPFRLRRTLHGHVLDLLECDPSADIHALSLHAHLASAYGRSFIYSREAADEAFERFAYLDAAALYRRCIDAAHGSPVDSADLAYTFEQLGQSLQLAGKLSEAERQYAAARRLSRETPLTMARLCHKTAILRTRLRQSDAARRWFARGLREIEKCQPTTDEVIKQRTRLQAGMAEWLSDRGDLHKAMLTCEDALNAAAKDDIAGRVAIKNSMLRVAHRLRDPAAKRYGKEALQLARQIGSAHYEAYILNNLAVDARKHGEWNRAVELFRKAEQLLEDLGRPVQSAAAAHNAAQILRDQGSLELALDEFSRSKDVFEAAGIAAFSHEADGNIGETLSRMGRITEGREILERVYETFRTTKSSHDRAGAAIGLSFNALMRLAPEDAEHLIEAERSAAAPDQRPQFARLAGYARLQLGDVEAARISFEESLQLARSVEAKFDIALAHEGLERLARITREDPGPHEREKQAIFDELGVVRTPEIPLPERVP